MTAEGEPARQDPPATQEGIPYTVVDFERACEAALQVQRRQGWWLAGASVLLAIPLLVSITALEERVGRTAHLALTLLLFSLYLGTMGVMLLGTRTRVNRARPVCPHCGVTLDPLAARIVFDTGRCNSCGGRVIE